MSAEKRTFYARSFAAWTFRALTWRGRQAVAGQGAITDQGGRVHILGGDPGRIHLLGNGPGRIFTGG